MSKSLCPQRSTPRTSQIGRCANSTGTVDDALPIGRLRKPFDVKQGKLITIYKCSRCGETKTEAT